MTPEEWSNRWVYILALEDQPGKVDFMKHEAELIFKEARNEALEEAAKVAEESPTYEENGRGSGGFAKRNIVDRILSLKSPAKKGEVG